MDQATWDPVPYAKDLAQEALALTRRTWGDVEIGDAQYQRWHYEANPAGETLSTFARDRQGGGLVGQFGVVPLRFSVDGEDCTAGLALNVVTDAALRGQGIFAGLGRAANERMAEAGISFAFALPNANSFPGFLRHLGYQDIGDVPLLARPVNVHRLVAKRLPLPGAGAVAALLSRPFTKDLPATLPEAAAIEIARVDRFDARFDALWQRVRGRQRVMAVRDATFLNWRFRDVPLRRYECFAAIEREGEGGGEEVAGYIVLRRDQIAGLDAGLVVDFVAANADAGTRLIAHALVHFHDQDLDLLAGLMLPHTAEYGLLRRVGFWPLPRPLLPQRFRVVARDGPAVRNLDNWFLTMGDYDVV